MISGFQFSLVGGGTFSYDYIMTEPLSTEDILPYFLNSTNLSDNGFFIAINNVMDGSHIPATTSFSDQPVLLITPTNIGATSDICIDPTTLLAADPNGATINYASVDPNNCLQINVFEFCDDMDNDGICNDVDSDIDGDGVPNNIDCSPWIAAYTWELDCAGICNGNGIEDECGVCNGPGAVYECGCSDLVDGTCDCDGNILDECGVCNGDNSTCSPQIVSIKIYSNVFISGYEFELTGGGSYTEYALFNPGSIGTHDIAPLFFNIVTNNEQGIFLGFDMLSGSFNPIPPTTDASDEPLILVSGENINGSDICINPESLTISNADGNPIDYAIVDPSDCLLISIICSCFICHCYSPYNP